MNTYKIPFLIFLIAAFNSCENDIPFNTKNNPPKLILNALIDANTEDNYIYLAQTGKDNIDSIRNATVNIYVNEVLKEQITENCKACYDAENNSYDITNKTKAYKTQVRFSHGDKVKIEAFANDGKYHAWAEDIVPKSVEIEQIDTATYTENNYNGSSSFIRLKSTFTDIPNEKNFYRITLTQTNTIYGENSNELDTIVIETHNILMNTREDLILNEGQVVLDDDILPQTENLYRVFNDTYLNGIYTMTTSFSHPASYYSLFYIYNPKRITFTFDIRLISITEMEYYYLKALNIINSEDYDEYLSMPVSFPSNVTGGVGFVGFSSYSHKTFNIPDMILETTEYNQAHYPH